MEKEPKVKKDLLVKDDKTKKWSAEKLQEVLRGDITKLFENVLDLAELAIGDKQRYEIFRSKVLRLGNNTIRKLSAEIDQNYEVNYTKVGVDILKIRQPTPTTKKEG